MQLSEAQSSELPIQFIQSKRERERKKNASQLERNTARLRLISLASYWLDTVVRQENKTRELLLFFVIKKEPFILISYERSI
jgi:hypothetical protein